MRIRGVNQEIPIFSIVQRNPKYRGCASSEDAGSIDTSGPDDSRQAYQSHRKIAWHDRFSGPGFAFTAQRAQEVRKQLCQLTGHQGKRRIELSVRSIYDLIKLFL